MIRVARECIKYNPDGRENTVRNMSLQRLRREKPRHKDKAEEDAADLSWTQATTSRGTPEGHLQRVTHAHQVSVSSFAKEKPHLTSSVYRLNTTDP